MGEEELLDLARINVLAAADEHVLHPPDDVAITLRIDGGKVAGVHPAIGVDQLRGALGIVPVVSVRGTRP